MPSSLSPMWLSLPLRRQLLPLLGTPGSTQLSSSSSLSIMASQFSGIMARKSAGLYCWQLGGSFFAMRSLLLYEEKCTPVRLTLPELVVCGFEPSTWSLMARGLSQLQLFIWSQVLPNIWPIHEQKAAHHSRKCELLLLRCCYISGNCEKWPVVNGSRKIISWKRSQALWSFTPQLLYTHMSPRMCSEMNPLIMSRSNTRHRFIIDVGIFALAFPFPLLLLFGAIAVSCKWSYIRNVSIMIQLHIAEGSPDGKLGKVQSCVGYRVCFGTRGVVLCKSGDVKIRMLSVCTIWEETRKQV